MRPDLPRGTDRAAAAAALLVAADLVLYLVLASGPDQDGPVAWVVVLLVVLTVIAAYAATGRRGHVPALVVAGILLGAVGLLAAFSIGLPLIVAAGLCLWSAFRASRAVPHDPDAPETSPDSP